MYSKAEKCSKCHSDCSHVWIKILSMSSNKKEIHNPTFLEWFTQMTHLCFGRTYISFIFYGTLKLWWMFPSTCYYFMKHVVRWDNGSVHGSVLSKPWLYLPRMTPRHLHFVGTVGRFCSLLVVCLEILPHCVIFILSHCFVQKNCEGCELPVHFEKELLRFLSVLPSQHKFFLPRFALSSLSDITTTIVLVKSSGLNITNPLWGGRVWRV